VITPAALKQRDNHANRRGHPALMCATLLFVFVAASFFRPKRLSLNLNVAHVISNAVD